MNRKITMPLFKSDAEILRYAVDRERISIDFYDQLVERTAKDDVRQLLQDMAREERKHKSKLELELMKLGQIVPNAEPQKGLDDTAIAAVLVDIHPEDIQAVLRLALEREHVSLRTYLSLAVECRSDPLREMLMILAEEEARHHALLQLEYDLRGLHRRSAEG